MELAWVDLLFATVLLMSVVMGLWRGLVFEVLSLAGWVAAYFGAPLLAPTLRPWLPEARFGPEVIQMASLVLAFVAILIVWSVGAKLVQLLIHASPLSVLDRLLGGAFGVLRGVLLSLLLVVIVSLTPAAHSVTWEASKVVPVLQEILQVLEPMLPPDLIKLIPA